MYLTLKISTDDWQVSSLDGNTEFLHNRTTPDLVQKVVNHCHLFVKENAIYKGGFTFTYGENKKYRVIYQLNNNLYELVIIDGDVSFEDADKDKRDALTGLLVKEPFVEKLAETMTDLATEKQLVLLDIDNFRKINEMLGHANADTILQQIVDRLLYQMVSDFDLYRFEGDCFAIIREGKKKNLEKVISQMQRIFESPFILDDRKIYISASIGSIDINAQNDTNHYSIIDKALVALSYTKEQGKGQWFEYQDSIKNNNLREMEMEGLIREALSEGSFTLNYQPQVSFEEQRIIGAEALIRWNHPTKGFISPGEFIPIAEKTGLIVQIGEWVVKEVCRQQREWLDKGLDTVKIGVNIGSLHFKKPRFVEFIKQNIEEYNIDASLLGLEITEGSVIDDVEDMIRKLKELKDMGIHISIDDFGTGYSSLSYLKKFEIDTLKIDQSFVINMSNIEEDIAIVRAIIDLAKNLKIAVIAEGVETDDVRDLLIEMNCKDMQGYLFSKPVNKFEFEEKLMNNTIVTN